MGRSIKKGPFVDLSLMDKIRRAKEKNSKTPIKTWSRRSMITPDFVGLTFSVHNAAVMPPEVQMQVFQRSFSTKSEAGRGIGTHSMKLLARSLTRCS